MRSHPHYQDTQGGFSSFVTLPTLFGNLLFPPFGVFLDESVHIFETVPLMLKLHEIVSDGHALIIKQIYKQIFKYIYIQIESKHLLSF